MFRNNASISIAILCSCAVLSKYLVIVPEYMVKYVGNAAWIDISAKCILATISLLLILWLYKPFAPMSFPDLFNLCGKNFAKALLSYIYIIAFTVFNSMLLRLLVEALSTVMATSAPDEFFSFFILVPVFIASYYGIISTSRLCCIIFPFVLLTLLTVGLALFPYYRIENLMPVFGISSQKLLDGIFTKHFGFFETILLLFFAPMLGSYKEIKKTGIITVATISIFTIVFTSAYCLTVPFPASSDFFLPFYQMTRMIKSGAFLQRLEPIVVFVWTSFVMCSMSVLISIAARLISQTTNPQKGKSFVPLITIITFFISMLPSSENAAFAFYEKLLSINTLLFPTLPIIILIIARARQRRHFPK